MLAQVDPSADPVVAPSEHSLLRFLTCGSVDDGKSTLIGRMLYECGAVFDDQLATLESDSKKYGTDGSNLDFALLVDGLSAEREQGITIDVAYRYFSTARRSFIVADTPGHEQYTRNMATGASTADLAVLLVDARKGLLQQTRRHAFIAAMLRVRHVVLAVNKMDMVGYDQNVFEKIEREFRKVSAPLDFASVTAIPLSARHGDNVVHRSAAMPWYEGQSLLDFLESVDVSRAGSEADDFVLPVQWVNRPDASFRGFSGTIAGGLITAGDRIEVQPGGRTSTVRRIVNAGADLDVAQAGQAITIELVDEIDISRGDAITTVGAQSVRTVAQATAQVIWTGGMPARENETYFVQIAGAQTQARLAGILHAVDVASYKRMAAEVIAMNGVAAVRLEFSRALPLADYSANRALGSFILIDRYSNETVAIGLIDSALAAKSLENVATARTVSPLGSLRLLTDRIAGVAGSSQRREFLQRSSWRITSAVLIAVIAGGISGSTGVAAFAGIADLAVRPLIYRWHRAIWGGGTDRDSSYRDGSGI